MGYDDWYSDWSKLLAMALLKSMKNIPDIVMYEINILYPGVNFIETMP